MASCNAPRPRLSAAIVAFDNEDLLAESIQSVRRIADEIKVLDARAPEAPEIVLDAPAQVVRAAGYGQGLAAAKNHLLNSLTGQWVLWLEPGEQLDPGTAADLRAFVDRQTAEDRVYSLNVEIPAATADASSEQAARIRLVPNRADLWYQGAARESLAASMEAAHVTADMAPGRILVHPACHDPSRKNHRALRVLDFLALEPRDRGPLPPQALLAEGEAASDLADWDRARAAFAQAVQIAPRGGTDMLDAYYGLLASFEGDLAHQTALAIQALEIYPLDAQLLCAMGTYLQAQGQVELAARAFGLAVQFGQVDPATWHLREIAAVATACHALTLQRLGRDDDARRVLEEAIQRSESPRLHRHLVELHIKHGRSEEAIQASKGLAPDPFARKNLRDVIRGACRAAAQQWTAALGYLQSAYLAGCRDPLCLRWLSITLLSNGQAEAAAPLLHQWQELEPNNLEIKTYLEAVHQAVSPLAAPSESDDLLTHQRWLRIDPGVTVLDTLPSPVPSDTPTRASQ